MDHDQEDLDIMADWAEAACTELGIDWDGDSAVVLGLTDEVSGSVSPLTGTMAAFLLGLAAGHGHTVAGAAVRLRDLADDWERG